MDGSVDFYRRLDEYAVGFGSLSGEFFYGLENWYEFTLTPRTARFWFNAKQANKTGTANYSNFRISSSATNYTLSSASFVSGTAGDSLSYHVGKKFFAPDPSDVRQGIVAFYPYRCPVDFHGAWWYGGCHTSNLNGKYLNGTFISYADGVVWSSFTGYYYSVEEVAIMLK